ncbi:ATP-binding protein [Salinicola halophilus]|uniref:ATP-binding protein n=1 Tax=Salinicola halophilus TaxID=184065 RepID=UPI000DA12518|nr:ATP-binding protein [Salinicola halophilus]
MSSHVLSRLTLGAGVALLMALGWHWFELQGVERHHTHQRLDGVVHWMLPSLQDAADSDDTRRLQALIERLTAGSGVAGVTLWQANGRARVQSGDATAPPPTLANRSGWQRLASERWIGSLGSPSDPLWLDLTFADTTAASPQARARLSFAAALAAALVLLALGMMARRRARSAAALLAPCAGGENSHSPIRASDSQASQSNALNRATQSRVSKREASMVTAMSPGDGRKLAFASHELRAPLSGMLGFCRLLEGSSLDARQREWLRHIDLASRGLLQTVDHVLGDRRRQQDDVFDIADLLWEVACLQAPLAQSKRMTLLPLVYDDVPPRLIGASVCVRQLLTNLINNAIKYGQAGDVVICVRLECRDAGGVRLRLSVHNDGELAPEQRQRMNRAVASSSAEIDTAPPEADDGRRKTSGLAICRDLVVAMDGTLRLDAATRGTRLTASFFLRACEPLARPAEFDLDGARVAVHQPHPRLSRLLDHALKRWAGSPSHISDADALAARAGAVDLLVVGIERDDLETDAAAGWQRRFDTLATPCLLLVDAEPTETVAWRLPAGSRVQRLPMSRYIFGRALTGMLDERRQRARTELPRVLVIDDDELSQHYLDAMISIVGACPLIADTFANGLRIASERHVDLVLMDRHLPDACGDEEVATLKGLDARWQQVPIVLMSADLEHDCAGRGPVHRPAEHIDKPLDEHRLRELLARHLPSPALTEAGPNAAADTRLTSDAPATVGNEPTADEPSVDAHDTNGLEADERDHDELALPVIDRALALHLAGGRQALADDLMTRLLEELPAHRHSLERAWQARNTAALSEAIHKLNGGCRYCGVPALSEAGEAFERRLTREGIGTCGAEWDALQEALARTVAFAPPGSRA